MPEEVYGHAPNPVGAGSGNVTGPAGATDNAVARFDGAGGATIQNSVVIVSDTGDITGANSLHIGGAGVDAYLIEYDIRRGGHVTTFASASGVAVPICSFSPVSLNSASGACMFGLFIAEGAGGNVGSFHGRFPFATVNKAGTLFVNSPVVITVSAGAISAGIISASASITVVGAVATLNVIPVWTVLTPVVKQIRWQIETANHDFPAVTPL